MEIKAKFTQMAIKAGGKVVLTFEMDEACAGALPDLATVAGNQVLLGITDPQTRIDLETEVDYEEVADGLAIYEPESA